MVTPSDITKTYRAIQKNINMGKMDKQGHRDYILHVREITHSSRPPKKKRIHTIHKSVNKTMTFSD
jgi:hypothetical protein